MSTNTTPYGVPLSAVTTLTSDGCTTGTFSFSANSNGNSIVEWEYQTTTDDGLNYSSSSSTVNSSVGINVNNNTNSYRMRVRARNAAGWGAFGNISTGSTTKWNYTSYSTTAACSGTACPDCDSCGSSSKTCYQYTRTGCTTTNCLDCGSCSSCGTWNSITAADGTTQTFNGVSYTAFSYWLGGSYWRKTNQTGEPVCGCDSYYGYTVTQCSVTNAYRVTGAGCIQWVISCGK